MRAYHDILGVVEIVDTNGDLHGDNTLYAVKTDTGGVASARKHSLTIMDDEPRPTALNELGKKCHATAKAKGWLDTPRSFGDVVALVHSELSEALEEHRNGRKPKEIYYRFPNGETRSHPQDEERNEGKPEGIPIEWADAIIRLVEYAAEQGIDLDEAVRIKMAYNNSRSYRHGGKVC